MSQHPPSFVPSLARLKMSASPSTHPQKSPQSVPSQSFYGEYHGHPLHHLHQIHKTIPATTPLIYLAGDSTLDNKYWLPPANTPSPPPLHNLLSPPLSRRDIAYWLNVLPFTSAPFKTLNTAVEATTLRQRIPTILPHDAFIADRIRQQDVLIVSVGGNDIALAPSLPLIFAALASTYLGPQFGISTLEKLFVHDMTIYIRSLIAKTNPKLVVLCGLYFPDQASVPSWAGLTLRVLMYASRPQRVQTVMRELFERMKRIRIDGVHIVHAPLFDVLDGTDTTDYVARVEPSESGGRKIATLLRDVIDRALAK